jgi:hypothetical protein
MGRTQAPSTPARSGCGDLACRRKRGPHHAYRILVMHRQLGLPRSPPGGACPRRAPALPLARESASGLRRLLRDQSASLGKDRRDASSPPGTGERTHLHCRAKQHSPAGAGRGACRQFPRWNRRRTRLLLQPSADHRVSEAAHRPGWGYPPRAADHPTTGVMEPGGKRASRESTDTSGPASKTGS